jgi:hypothetical protein
MSEENKDAYDVVLADLLAQRERIDAAISAIQAARGGAGAAAAQPSGGANSAKVEPDSFFGMTVLEAAKKFLGMTKRPQKANAIADALKQGGYHFATDNALPTVASVLNRDDAKGGEIVRVGKGLFALAAWYKTRPKKDRQPDEEAEDANPLA